ncbi:hypothetical protein [Pseudomonas sp. UBA6310]|uniref:hypothetical protein n=1 Tax=Pseudomonas sp. UBA6310 TaxID=1947327 RepID=UPI002580D07D|nr:hypothetical protein [Pseudomonas sp. UBA6310]
MDINVLQVEVARLDLRAGDTLAVMLKSPIRLDAREHLADLLRQARPEWDEQGIKVMVFDSGIELRVIKPGDQEQSA